MTLVPNLRTIGSPLGDDIFFKLQAGAVKNEKAPKWESRCPTVPLERAQ